ncbi:winged helix-turn-helix transcriptional regulator [Paractinoplanes ferrugineus]|uniref:HxlR family transcriptional regulator n=1 Tax=Paractinoplanes ferrugineus TaxID=113564 RepID=A0A919J4R6_9ACTN|nr:helix-turn-helix domain-containing protein [Actinoplanes ferrugineus]GIE12504.1 HxlR family transcriptional regulator [Actinoplanes ferrugineus]
MPTSRRYGDACPIARALDVVGERWALLVVRELLLGPLRFADLRRALPGASSNMLTDRLRELETNGVLVRRRPAAPAAATGYELTDTGRRLEPVLDALGAFGSTLPATGAHLSATSVLLYLRGSGRPRAAGTYRLELDDRVFTVRSHDGRVVVVPGEPGTADASLRTDPVTFNALLADPDALPGLVAGGSAAATGAVDRLLAG